MSNGTDDTNNKVLSDLISIIDVYAEKVSNGTATLEDYEFVESILRIAKVDVQSKLKSDGFENWAAFLLASKNKKDMEVMLRVSSMIGRITGNLNGLKDLITKRISNG